MEDHITQPVFDYSKLPIMEGMIVKMSWMADKDNFTFVGDTITGVAFVHPLMFVNLASELRGHEIALRWLKIIMHQYIDLKFNSIKTQQ